MDEEELKTGGTLQEQSEDRRMHPRYAFTYPIEFKTFIRNSDQTAFNVDLKDLSKGGACLEFEDKYRRFNIDQALNARVKISFRIPKGETVIVFAHMRWIKRSDLATVTVGLEFRDIEDWQVTAIEKLINLKSKDRSMMWNLWEQYDR